MTQRLVVAIETASAPGGVAVGIAGATLAETVLDTAVRHSELVLPAIEDSLRRAGGSMKDVEAVVVGAGPGSFTGVRIAAATAKGLVHARGCELHAFSSLLAAAHAADLSERAVCALFDARRGEAFVGCWRGNGGTVQTILAPTAQDVTRVVAELAEHRPLYVGDGAVRNRTAIENGGGTVAPLHATSHCASSLLALYESGNGASRVADPASWQPTYIRPPNVTMPAQSSLQ